jgi:hypothetical protein
MPATPSPMPLGKRCEIGAGNRPARQKVFEGLLDRVTDEMPSRSRLTRYTKTMPPDGTRAGTRAPWVARSEDPTLECNRPPWRVPSRAALTSCSVGK